MRSFLNLDNYDFLLPRELIASKPSEVRGNSRLLVLEREIKDRTIDNLVDYLDSGDLLVINDTKVLKARLKGKRSTRSIVYHSGESTLDDSNYLSMIFLRILGPEESLRTALELICHASDIDKSTELKEEILSHIKYKLLESNGRLV